MKAVWGKEETGILKRDIFQYKFKQGENKTQKLVRNIKSTVAYESYRASFFNFPSIIGHDTSLGLKINIPLLGLKSGGPWLKSSNLPPPRFFLFSPEFNSSTASCK